MDFAENEQNNIENSIEEKKWFYKDAFNMSYFN